MAGLAIEVKCKGIEAYRLGGVQKIELEQHKVDDEVCFSYIATTIFDTRRYAFEDVEYIKVYGGAVVTTDDELQHILKFAAEEDVLFDVVRRQLRSLWTAYCLHKGYECDTLQYDTALRLVWSSLLENDNYDVTDWQDNEDEGVVGFDLFDDYMCEELV